MKKLLSALPDIFAPIAALILGGVMLVNVAFCGPADETFAAAVSFAFTVLGFAAFLGCNALVIFMRAQHLQSSEYSVIAGCLGTICFYLFTAGLVFFYMTPDMALDAGGLIAILILGIVGTAMLAAACYKAGEHKAQAATNTQNT